MARALLQAASSGGREKIQKQNDTYARTSLGLSRPLGELVSAIDENQQFLCNFPLQQLFHVGVGWIPNHDLEVGQGGNDSGQKKKEKKKRRDLWAA